MKKFLKPGLYILLIIVAVVVIYRLVSTKSLDVPTGLTAQFEYYTAGDTTVIPLNCSFTTPSSYGDGATSFTGIKVYIADCGTSACTPAVQPVKPTDDELANQKFVDLTKTGSIVVRDGNSEKINSQISAQILNLKGNYTTGNTYSIGIAMMNDQGMIGDFAYTTAVLKSGPGAVTGLSSSFKG
jgi:hypothetical protein